MLLAAAKAGLSQAGQKQHGAGSSSDFLGHVYQESGDELSMGTGAYEKVSRR